MNVCIYKYCYLCIYVYLYLYAYFFDNHIHMYISIYKFVKLNIFTLTSFYISQYNLFIHPHKQTYTNIHNYSVCKHALAHVWVHI